MLSAANKVTFLAQFLRFILIFKNLIIKTMKKIFIFFIAFFTPFLEIVNSQTQTPEQIYKSAEGSILFVRGYDEEGYSLCQGSAVLVNEGYIYTCFHIYNGTDAVVFEVNGSKYRNPIIAGADPEKDIIIFKIKDLESKGIKTGNSDSICPGQTVYALGNPMGYKKTFSSGIISSIRNDYRHLSYGTLQFSASISGGSSGGALLNTNGELIGITSSNVEKGNNLNFAILINDFLQTKLIDTEDSIQVKAMSDFCKGYSCYKNFGYYEANEFFNSSMEYFANDVNILTYSGQNYSRRGQYDSALIRFNEIISHNPGDKKAYSERGWVYYYKKDTALALNDFNKAIEIDSGYFDAIFGRAYLYLYLMNYYSLAINDFDKLLELEPDYIYLYKYRAEAYIKLDNQSKALSDLYASINYDVDNFITCYERGNLFLDMDEYTDAIRDYTQAIKLDPENYEYYFGRAFAYSRNHDYYNAINDYKEGLKFASSNAAMLNNLAYCYLNLSEYEDAEKNFKRALFYDPRHFDSFLGLSILYFKQNKKSACIKHVKQAIEIEPLLKKGIKGLENLENKGYSWSFSDKETLNKIFGIAGYFYYEEKTIEERSSGKKARTAFIKNHLSVDGKEEN